MKLTYLKKNKNFIYLSFGCAGSLLPVGVSLVAASRGCSLVVVCRLLIAGASLIADHGPWGMRASAVVARGISSCGLCITG